MNTLDAAGAELAIQAGRQRLIRQNWKFSSLPKLVLSVLLLVLAWEILRQNAGPGTWPWTITVLGITPAATLAGVFASLIVAREQFARSMRPNLAWSSHQRGSEKFGGDAWIAQLMNFGPGIAHVARVLYSVEVVFGATSISKDRITRAELVNVLHLAGLREGQDFALPLMTPGAPLAVVRNMGEGIEFAAIGDKARAQLKRLDFELEVIDIMGDEYGRSLPFIATLPALKVEPLSAATKQLEGEL